MSLTTSVLICSRGRPALLLDAVRSVLAMDRLPDQLVVVDQSDAPQADLAAGTVGDASSVTLTYLWSPDRGLSRARNVALRAATGDIVAIMDDDLLVDPHWLDAYVRGLTASGEDARRVLTGLLREGAPETPGAWAPSTNIDTQPRSYSGPQRRDVLAAGTMAMYRSVAQDVGLFDERLGAGTSLPSAEDNDYCYRLLRAGYTIEYRPEASAVHRAWRRENALARLKFDYGHGQGGFYLKHLLAGDLSMARRLGGDVYGHLRRAVVRLMRRRLREALSDLTYIAGLGVGAVGWFRVR